MFALLSCTLSFFAACSAAEIKGANLGGFLLIEEWMFSNGMYDKVAELEYEPQGVILPPALPNGFGEMWFSEGDLVNKLFNKFGESKTIQIMEDHRAAYITQEDFDEMARAGITKVRVPVGWWAFANESVGDKSVLITDPAHQDRKFVTIPQSLLTEVLAGIHKAGMTSLLDIHAFPGGSASGSYSGIFPNTPMFFKDPSLQSQGLEIINNLCDFYSSLEEAVRKSVGGVTLMNEPAHMLPDDGATMQVWLAQAVDIYRERVVSEFPADHPLLYVNLISTCMSDQDMLSFMVNTFSADELKQWAILDVHVYYAWDGSHAGCTNMYGDCAFACSVDNNEEDFESVTNSIREAAASSHQFFSSNGSVPLLSCSEFSLATYHDSNNACRGQNMLDMMYQAQADGFEAQGILDNAMFWSWKMPYGGSHEAGWSLQKYFSRRSAQKLE